MTGADDQTYTLPCAFRWQRQGADELELLSAGTPLTELDDAGTIGVRSRWVGLTADFQINRAMSRSKSRVWGTFDYRRLAAREGTPLSDLWLVSSDARTAGKVSAQLEMTQLLDPFLQLCQGAPHYLMPARPDVSLDRHFGEHYWLEPAHRLSEIPAAIHVSGQADEKHPDGAEMELFPAWLPGPDDDITTHFRESFRYRSDPQLAPTSGRISDPLPPPASNGEYRFSLRWHDGREETVHVKRMPDQWTPTSLCVATLDTRGRLTVHRGRYPPYWVAGSLKAVQEHPGSVFRVRMDSPDRGRAWDRLRGSN